MDSYVFLAFVIKALCGSMSGIVGDVKAFSSIEGRTDFCLLKSETGPCRGNLARYYYDSKKDECIRFVYGGCQGNDNNFISQKGCEATCSRKVVCSFPKEQGPCMGYFLNYFFNSANEKCEQFIYGGCMGNKNNFKTRKQCEQRCKPDVCLMKPENGPCMAYFPRYFFNATTATCERFIYGGCQGNENNFAKLEDCKRRCL